MRTKIGIMILVGALTLNVNAQRSKIHIKSTLPDKLPPIPAVQNHLELIQYLWAIQNFSEIQLDIPVTPGPFEPNWESIENYPGEPAWLRGKIWYLGRTSIGWQVATGMPEIFINKGI